MNELTKLGKHHGTDKAGPEHNYTEAVYYHMLKKIKDKDIKLLELGVGNTGASIKMWRDYLQNAEITLFDPFFIIDPAVTVTPEELQNLGVRVIKGNQLSREDLATLSDEEEYYDIIIDDASHVLDGISLSLANLLPYLNKNGCYVIEDLSCARNRDRRLDDCHRWLDGETVDQTIKKIYHQEEYHILDTLENFKRTGKWKSKILNDDEIHFLEQNIGVFKSFIDNNSQTNLVVIKRK